MAAFLLALNKAACQGPAQFLNLSWLPRPGLKTPVAKPSGLGQTQQQQSGWRVTPLHRCSAQGPRAR